MKKQNFIFILVAIVVSGAYIFYSWKTSDNNWQTTGSAINYTDDQGNKLTGWHIINSRPYYFDEQGNLLDRVDVIDVSEYQGDIDWAKVASSGIKMAMLRSSYGSTDFPSQVDKKFEKNIQAAKAAGVKVGVYHYSYANSAEAAQREAEYCLKAIKNYEIDLPIAYDVEDKFHIDLSKDQISEIIESFCNKIKDSGYLAMIYTPENFAKNKIDYERLQKYDFWIAKYNGDVDWDKPFLMWQHSNTGKIPGIKTSVDLNYYYFDKSIKDKIKN